MQAEKTPEPLSHPYTRATHSLVSAEPAPRTVTAGRQGLNLCFVVWRGERIFLTQSENSFPWGIEPGTWEVSLTNKNMPTLKFVGLSEISSTTRNLIY
jgi:hypothetical protein